jgi:hypothetical protein
VLVDWYNDGTVQLLRLGGDFWCLGACFCADATPTVVGELKHHAIAHEGRIQSYPFHRYHVISIDSTSLGNAILQQDS